MITTLQPYVPEQWSAYYSSYNGSAAGTSYDSHTFGGSTLFNAETVGETVVNNWFISSDSSIGESYDYAVTNAQGGIQGGTVGTNSASWLASSTLNSNLQSFFKDEYFYEVGAGGGPSNANAFLNSHYLYTHEDYILNGTTTSTNTTVSTTTPPSTTTATTSRITNKLVGEGGYTYYQSSSASTAGTPPSTYSTSGSTATYSTYSAVWGGFPMSIDQGLTTTTIALSGQSFILSTKNVTVTTGVVIYDSTASHLSTTTVLYNSSVESFTSSTVSMTRLSLTSTSYFTDKLLSTCTLVFPQRDALIDEWVWPQNQGGPGTVKHSADAPYHDFTEVFSSIDGYATYYPITDQSESSTPVITVGSGGRQSFSYTRNKVTNAVTDGMSVVFVGTQTRTIVGANARDISFFPLQDTSMSYEASSFQTSNTQVGMEILGNTESFSAYTTMKTTSFFSEFLFSTNRLDFYLDPYGNNTTHSVILDVFSHHEFERPIASTPLFARQYQYGDSNNSFAISEELGEFFTQIHRYQDGIVQGGNEIQAISNSFTWLPYDFHTFAFQIPPFVNATDPVYGGLNDIQHIPVPGVPEPADSSRFWQSAFGGNIYVMMPLTASVYEYNGTSFGLNFITNDSSNSLIADSMISVIASWPVTSFDSSGNTYTGVSVETYTDAFIGYYDSISSRTYLTFRGGDIVGGRPQRSQDPVTLWARGVFDIYPVDGGSVRTTYADPLINANIGLSSQVLSNTDLFRCHSAKVYQTFQEGLNTLNLFTFQRYDTSVPP